MNGRKNFLFATLIFATSFLKAQKMDEPPLFKYLQNNFDTAYVFDAYSGWDLAWPNYKIVGIKNHRLFFFRYSSPQAPRYSQEYSETKPDSNQYFLFMPVSTVEQERFRASLDSIDLWKMTTDDRSNCTFRIYDAGDVDFYMLSKNNRKKVNFEAPDFYERACPGDKNRQVAIRFIRLMNSVIPWR